MKPKSNVGAVLVIVILVSICISCGPERQRLAVAFVIDLTGSIDQEATQEALASLNPLFEKKRLQRGDSLYVIPITGDTLTESQGHILRFHLSEKREVYDSDLQELAKEVKDRVAEMRTAAMANPYKHSDILGAAGLAAEELSLEKGNVSKKIVILSDFIQDDSRYNFNTHADLASESSAAELAKRLTEKSKKPFENTELFLGILRSKDLRKMNYGKRVGLQSFWQHYFELSGARSLSWATDGPGQIAAVLQRVE
ncbi:MAG TPA: hypothetical protein VFS76_01900 [Pyrinomonadaceae bacterium]|nr:hypothetical protein [Pyrinomonadaceae bacterium]